MKALGALDTLLGPAARTFPDAWSQHLDIVPFSGVHRRLPALFTEDLREPGGLLSSHTARWVTIPKRARGGRATRGQGEAPVAAMFGAGKAGELLEADRSWPALGQLARGIRHQLGLELSRIRCAVYATPRGVSRRGQVPPGSTWVVGIAGTVAFTAPTRAARTNARRTFEVRRGDGLFVPRGASWVTTGDGESVMALIALERDTLFDVCITELRQTLPRDPRWRALYGGERFKGDSEEKLAELARALADLLERSSPESVLDDYDKRVLRSPFRTTATAKARLVKGGRSLVYDAGGKPQVLALAKEVRAAAAVIVRGAPFSIAHLRQAHTEASATELSALVTHLLDYDVIEPVLEARWKPVVRRGTDRRL